MAIFSDRDLSFSEVCEDLSWSAPGPRITKWCARNFTLVSSRAPCVAGRLGRARGVWLFVEVRVLLVLSHPPSLPTQLGRGTGINCCIFLPIKRSKMLPKSQLRPSHRAWAGLCSGVGSRGGATLRVLPLGAVSRPGRCVGCGDWGGDGAAECGGFVWVLEAGCGYNRGMTRPVPGPSLVPSPLSARSLLWMGATLHQGHQHSSGFIIVICNWVGGSVLVLMLDDQPSFLFFPHPSSQL